LALEQLDSIIDAKWLIPVVPEGKILNHHSLLIRHGKIVDIIPTREVMGRYQSIHHIKLDNHALLPGFVNSHCHSPMSLMRGIADDLPLKAWLEKHIWPLEAKFLDEQYVADGTSLAVAEMIRSGTTCLVDQYFYPETSAEIISEIGFRARLGLPIIDIPTNWAKNIDEYFEHGLKLTQDYMNHPLISCQFSPHAPYTVSDDALKRISTLSTELEIPIQMHIHETIHEIQEAMAEDDMRPLQRLENLGLLGPELQAVHMTQITEQEISKLASYGIQVIHCPESNMKLASGICPVTDLMAAGINVALGTDGAASNNDLDMISEMRSAAFLAKVSTHDATALSAAQVLSMATINGAKAIGLEEQIGSLEAGKQADITAIDLSGLEQQPIYNPISQIIYSSDRKQVTDVWVAGRHLMKDRLLTTIDIDSVSNKAIEWQKKFSS